jgi:formylglycine-generating enzyme required for sulfatase activity
MFQHANRCFRGISRRAAFLVVCFLIPCGRLLATEKLPDYEQQTIGKTIAMVGVDGGAFRRCEYEPALLGRRNWNGDEARVSPFWIGKYEITFGEFHEWVMEWGSPDKATSPAQEKAREVIGLDETLLTPNGGWPTANNASPDLYGNAKHPAFGMKQWTAKRYCHWLSMLTGRFYRLPTEAEWEFACLADSKDAKSGYRWGTSAYPWGWNVDEIDTYAVTGLNKRVSELALVGSKKPNAWGIHDMIGNVEEWVADGYAAPEFLPRQPDPIVWPASKHLSQDAAKIWKEFKDAGQRYCDGWGVAKGGSYDCDRSQQPAAFTVAARTDPERHWHDWDPYNLPQDNGGRYLEGPMAHSIGFRIARPITVPDRKFQLWHWGIYFDHDKWQHLTLQPTEANADHRGP